MIIKAFGIAFAFHLEMTIFVTPMCPIPPFVAYLGVGFVFCRIPIVRIRTGANLLGLLQTEDAPEPGAFNPVRAFGHDLSGYHHSHRGGFGRRSFSRHVRR